MKIFNDRSIVFFDFFIKDIGKIIEFDGDYWYGNSGYKLYHVNERDYKSKPQEVVENCIRFIYG